MAQPPDSDLIARVYLTSPAALLLHEELKDARCPHYNLPPEEPPYLGPQHDGLGNRASTVGPDESPTNSQSSMYHAGCLEFRFSRGPQTGHGIVFGRHRTCDVVLSIPTLSNHHFALTFDNQRRLVIKDLGSRAGTEVTYGAQGGGRRRDFVWIVGGDAVLKSRKANNMTINIPGEYRFKIEVPWHDVHSQPYIDKVHKFLEGTLDADGLVRRLDIRNPPQSKLATGTDNPFVGPIEIRDKLGEGGFGLVTRVWDVSTAAVYAVKQPTELALRKDGVNVGMWKREALILSRLSHNHIVKLLGSNFDLTPQLYFEYMPGGSLDDYHDLSVDQCGQILCQCLDALTYLHNLNPPLVHRDIKPGNILVQSYGSSHPGSIHVKFGDFGLSRQSADPLTICGTSWYLPPEMQLEGERRKISQDKQSYTPAVDIWSLGVVIMELLPEGLPSPRGDDWWWCRRIVDQLNIDLERAWNPMLQFLSDYMLLMKPEDRASTQRCFKLAEDNFNQDCPTPRRLHYCVSGSEGCTEAQQTALASAANAPGPQPDLFSENNSVDLNLTTKPHRSSHGGSALHVPPQHPLSPALETESQASRLLSWSSLPSSGTRESQTAVDPRRLSQIPGLLNPLHELGGGSYLAALGSQD